ncbi:hypothetical protein HYY74_06725 [Candidatus Woesearchaeota archaeon]|nr:hypothetical protein [Candidatus Woesearchaeota archaeon]
MIRITPDRLIKAIIIFFAAFLIYNVILKLLGGSLTNDQILFSFLIAGLSILYNNSKGLARLEAKFDMLEKSFRMLADDFRNHSHKHGKIGF